jgi:hypothetical protein
MYRDDLAATHARLEQIQRELNDAQAGQVHDQQRIAALTAQLAAAQQALQRLGAAPQFGYGNYVHVPRGGTILTLGILSLVLCGFLGPVAWAMGNEELRRIDGGLVDPMTRSNASAGRVCGIIATVFLIVGAVFFVAVFAAIGNGLSRL